MTELSRISFAPHNLHYRCDFPGAKYIQLVAWGWEDFVTVEIRKLFKYTCHQVFLWSAFYPAQWEAPVFYQVAIQLGHWCDFPLAKGGYWLLESAVSAIAVLGFVAKLWWLDLPGESHLHSSAEAPSGRWCPLSGRPGYMPGMTRSNNFYGLDIHTCLSRRTCGNQEKEMNI